MSIDSGNIEYDIHTMTKYCTVSLFVYCLGILFICVLKPLLCINLGSFHVSEHLFRCFSFIRMYKVRPV